MFKAVGDYLRYLLRVEPSPQPIVKLISQRDAEDLANHLMLCAHTVNLRNTPMWFHVGYGLAVLVMPQDVVHVPVADRPMEVERN